MAFLFIVLAERGTVPAGDGVDIFRLSPIHWGKQLKLSMDDSTF